MTGPADIRAVALILTAECNLRCRYCYQNDKKPRRMTRRTLLASIDLLLRSRRPEVHLEFVGGEPLLQFALVRRGVSYAKKTKKPGLSVRYGVTTNGTLLAPEHVAFFDEHGVDVQVSFDGVPAAQNLRGRGTFRRLDRLLQCLRVDYPSFFSEKLTVAVTVAIPAIRHLADSFDYLLNKGVKRIAIAAAMGQHGWEPEWIKVLDRQFARIFESSVSLYGRTGEVPLLLFRKEQPDSAHAPVGRWVCGAGLGESLAVDVDGQVHGCVMLAESYQTFPDTVLTRRLATMRLGDVAAPDFARRLAALPEAARAAGIFQRTERKYSSYGRCRDCRAFGSCLVCPMSVAHDGAHTDPDRIPDFLCAFNRVAFRYRHRFPRQPTVHERLTGRAAVPGLVKELQTLVARHRSGPSRASGRDLPSQVSAQLAYDAGRGSTSLDRRAAAALGCSRTARKKGLHVACRPRRV